MFRCVVYRNSQNDSYSVQEFRDSKLDSVVEYSSIEKLPNNLKETIKQMLWVNPNDHSMTANLGIRVGDNAFWILDRGESHGTDDNAGTH